MELILWLYFINGTLYLVSGYTAYIPSDEPVDQAAEESNLKLIIMIAGGVGGVIIVIWIVVCIYCKCCRSKKSDDGEEPELTSIQPEDGKVRPVTW